MEETNISSLLIGAGLAIAGGLITQFVVHWKIKRDAKSAMLVALTSELKVMREDINTNISGTRTSLRDDDDILPRPDDFSPSTVVFDANAGSLGLLRDTDLVDHLVEVYSTVRTTREDAIFFRPFPNSSITRRSVEDHHAQATMAQIAVMKLHNRLAFPNDSKPHNIHSTEEESRQLAEIWRADFEQNPPVYNPSYPREGWNYGDELRCELR